MVVTGYAIRYPAGDLLMGFLHHVYGLHRLGHEVFYVEESGWPQANLRLPGRAASIARHCFVRQELTGPLATR